MTHRQPNSIGKRLGLTVFLSLPFFIVAMLIWLIGGSLAEQGATSRSDVANTTKQP